jgi:hypothetical protein
VPPPRFQEGGTLSLQYINELISLSFVRPVSQSGCKCTAFFLSAKLFRKKIPFLLPADIRNRTYVNVAPRTPFPQTPELLRWRGANLPPFFKSTRIFQNFFPLFQSTTHNPLSTSNLRTENSPKKGTTI